MPLFVGRARKATSRFIPSASAAVSFDAFDLALGTKQVTIRGTGGVTHVGYAVVADVAPTFPWYPSSAFDNIALVGGAVTVTITLNRIGDRLKVFKSAAAPIGATSRDLSVQSDSGPAVSGNLPPPNPGVMGPLARASGSGVNAIWLARPDGQVPVLVGAHNWSHPFQDYAEGDPPQASDFNGFLNWVRAKGWTFVRGWRWENTKDDVWRSLPHPWARTGPGNASDGKLKFNLTQFDAAWETRYTARLQALQTAGIYTSVMLYNLWSVSPSNSPGTDSNYLDHPFQPGNNINGVDATGGTRLENAYNLANSPLMAVQNAYLDKMVDICNPYLNVIYEACNQPRSTVMHNAFFNHVVDRVRTYQVSKPIQHPVWYSSPLSSDIGGAGGSGAGDNSQPIGSNADIAGVILAPTNPTLNNNRPWAVDTNHSYNMGGSPDWCWRMFTRGCQIVVNMDSLQNT